MLPVNLFDINLLKFFVKKAQSCRCCTPYPWILCRWSHLCFKWYLTQITNLSTKYSFFLRERTLSGIRLYIKCISMMRYKCQGRLLSSLRSLVSDPAFNDVCYPEAAGLQRKNSQLKILKNWCRKWGLWNQNYVLSK